MEVSHFYFKVASVITFLITECKPVPAAGASSLHDVSPPHSAEGMASSSQSSEGGASAQTTSIPQQLVHSGGE